MLAVALGCSSAWLGCGTAESGIDQSVLEGGTDAGSGGTAGVADSGSNAGNGGTASVADSATPAESGCPGTKVKCTGECVDTSSDLNHCGGCGMSCPSFMTCGGAVCQLCTFTICGGDCIDTNADSENCGACGNACGPGQACCAGSCLAVNVAIDPHNCGRCGHDCQGGTCEYGTCQPIVVAEPCCDPIWDLKVDSTHVYWSIFSLPWVIQKVGHGGGTPVTIVENGKHFALDSTSLYFNREDCSSGLGSTINRANLDGMEEIELVGSETCPGIQAMVVDATSLYWTSEYAGTVTKVGLEGGPVYVLAAGQSQPNAIAVDATAVYWAAEKGIMKVGLNGGEVVTLVGWAEPHNHMDIAVFDGYLYWAESGSFPYDNAGRIMRIRVDGANLETLVDQQTIPSSIAVDASGVYWNDYEGTLKKAGLHGDNPITLVLVGSMTSIALDASSVYWALETGGYTPAKVMKLAK